MEPFLKGFRKVMNSKLLEMFSGGELQTLICGNPSLNFFQLEKHMIYKGYTKDSNVIRYFWEVVHEMSLEDKKKLLFFITGSDRAPVRGLASLNMIIERHGADSH